MMNFAKACSVRLVKRGKIEIANFTSKPAMIRQNLSFLGCNESAVSLAAEMLHPLFSTFRCRTGIIINVWEYA